MHILLTNDDGIFAPGLAALYKPLTRLGKVTVAAPSEVRSGAGHSITLNELTFEYVDIVGKFAGYSIAGSPADCVKLALKELIGPNDPVDLVVSGMNHGANVGINVFYSGTVAGAIEAAFYNFPAIAVSAAMDEPMAFEQAAEYAFEVLSQLAAKLSPNEVVNLNIPQLSKGKPQGVRIVPQSTCGFTDSYYTRHDKGQPVYQLTCGDHRDDKDGHWTDTTALDAGYITLTALRKDLTDPTTNKRLNTMGLDIANPEKAR